MKPNFETMTNAELRDYALKHRNDEDIEALRVLFNRRESSSSIKFNFPKNKKEEREQFELFKQIIADKEGNKN